MITKVQLSCYGKQPQAMSWVTVHEIEEAQIINVIRTNQCSHGGNGLLSACTPKRGAIGEG